MNPSKDLAELPTWIASRAAARAHKLVHEHLSRTQTSGYEYRVLAAVDALGECTQASLGRHASLDRRDVTSTVRALEGRGLLTRRDDPSDARVQLVALTPHGLAAWPRIALAVKAAQEEFLSPIAASERRSAVDILKALGDFA